MILAPCAPPCTNLFGKVKHHLIDTPYLVPHTTGFVIHGTAGLFLKDNTAFHVSGNCFYIEDGVEENNWLEHNFAGYVHVIGTPAGGPDQSGTLHVQAGLFLQGLFQLLFW